MDRAGSAPAGVTLESSLDTAGLTWRGYQTATGQSVVVRFLADDADPRLLSERLQVLSQLDLPRVVLPLDMQLVGENRYLVFPHFPVTLAQAGGTRHTSRQVKVWLAQLAETLEVTHRHNLFHGALSEGNLLLDRESSLRIDGWLTHSQSTGTGPLQDLQDLGRLGFSMLGASPEPNSADPLHGLLWSLYQGDHSNALQLLKALNPPPTFTFPSQLWQAGILALLGGLLFDLRLFALAGLGALIGAVAGMWIGWADFRWRTR